LIPTQRNVHTGSSITIQASREEIFAIVSDLTRWTKVLPHYRFIRFLGKEGDKGTGRDIVHMGARRGVIPISWVSAYSADATTLELRFEHLRAWTKGMKVVWTLTPTRDATRVELVHTLKFRFPPLAWLAEPVIGKFFIEHIANRTLSTFKTYIEANRAPETRGDAS
jgi:ribosome-associated toxin RatA of RatAB toxin-antitoxin module